MIARPGADGGYVEALLLLNHQLNLGMSPKQVFDKVYVAITRMGNTFYMHTDDHAERAHEGIGCGHMAKACMEENAAKYGVEASEMEAVIDCSKARAQEDNRLRMVVLHGLHKEEGVIIVTGREFTASSQGDGQMYFVYDEARDNAFMMELVEELNVAGVNFDNFRAASDQQLRATLRILAAGKPVFRANLDEEKPQVAFAGRI